MNYLKKVFQSKTFIIAMAAILIYTLAGFLLTPYLVRRYLPRIIQGTLNKQAATSPVKRCLHPKLLHSPPRPPPARSTR